MKKNTIKTLQGMKQQGEKIATLTAYDASFAALMSEAGMDAILVGDSLGMVIGGQSTTVPVTIDEVAYHTRCVARGSKRALLLADMPYMSYSHPTQAIENATKLMQAGAEMVKLEGGSWLCLTVQQMTERGIPVCAHLGLTPQSVHILGGFKVQGREAKAAQKILNDAMAMERAGAQLLIVECVPSTLAQELSRALTIPVIGIGAGSECDGQILVMHDMLGITQTQLPSFAKNFMDNQPNGVSAAIENYIREVKEERFPGPEHTFSNTAPQLSAMTA